MGPARLVIGGAGGDSGKTLVSLGLVAAWRQNGLDVAAFKKGPDYIDAAWLARAADRPVTNLDVWIMGRDEVARAFVRRSAGADVSVVEGNRGVLDGYRGHSTAALARLLDAPMLLTLDVTKVTRTSAAIVAGIKALDPELRFAGVIANRVGGARHEREVRTAIEEATGIPVLGAVPKLSGRNLLPDRHLGLVPPEEHDRMGEVVDRLAAVLREHVDLETLLSIARSAPETGSPPKAAPPASGDSTGERVRIGVFMDAAFTFYYPENLEALRAEGAEIIPISALSDSGLPELDLLYIGGGFPETQAAALAGNRSMLASVRSDARAGLPIYAECGGLIYLSRSVTYGGRRSELSGVLALDVVVEDRPQGHGYAEMVVDRENPFFPPGTVLRGHEFHHARIDACEEEDLVLDVRKGAGSLGKRDGFTVRNVLAGWLHLHASGAPDWAPALALRARRRAKERRNGDRENGSLITQGSTTS